MKGGYKSKGCEDRIRRGQNGWVKRKEREVGCPQSFLTSNSFITVRVITAAGDHLWNLDHSVIIPLPVKQWCLPLYRFTITVTYLFKLHTHTHTIEIKTDKETVHTDKNTNRSRYMYRNLCRVKLSNPVSYGVAKQEQFFNHPGFWKISFHRHNEITYSLLPTYVSIVQYIEVLHLHYITVNIIVILRHHWLKVWWYT